MRQAVIPKTPMVPDVTAMAENEDELPANQVIPTLDIPPRDANHRPAVAGDQRPGFLRNSSSPNGRTNAKADAATSAGRNRKSGAVTASPRPAPRHIRIPAIRKGSIR
jgi:hypothetical protein